MKKIIIFILLGFMTQFCEAQSVHKLLRKGNKLYEDEKYDEAAEKYHKALEKEQTNVKGKFNLGNASYASEDYDAAIEQFSAAAELADDDAVKANSFYNLGNSYFKKAKEIQDDSGELGFGESEGKDQEAFKQSMEAYKNALRLNPNDDNAKRNLALAQRYIRRKQQQQQQQQQKENQQQQQQNQQQQEEQQQENQNQNQQQQQQSDAQKKQQKSNEGEGEKTPKELTKEEAMELLKIINNEEKRVQEKLRKDGARGKKLEKDW